jgi:hypothetical protein
MSNKQFQMQQPSFYQNGFIPPPPHLTNYNYNQLNYPCQGYGVNPQNYPPFTYPSNFMQPSIGHQQNGFGQFPNHPTNPNHVSFNYNMNFFVNPYSFPMVPQSGMPVFNPFLDIQKYYGNHTTYNQQSPFNNNRIPTQNVGPIQDSGLNSRINKPPVIDLVG